MLRVLLLLLAMCFWLWEHPAEFHYPAQIPNDIRATLDNAAVMVWRHPEEKQSPGILVPAAPAMYTVHVHDWVSGQYTITAIDSYFAHARVLGKEHYSMDREADLAPYDLALGWQEMSDTAVLSRLDISQSDRWWHYHWDNAPPILPNAIPLEAGNMHIIPGDPNILRTLNDITVGNVIYLEGFLVHIQAPDGWNWTSGLSNDSEGQGGCKVIWVTKLQIER